MVGPAQNKRSNTEGSEHNNAIEVDDGVHMVDQSNMRTNQNDGDVDVFGALGAGEPLVNPEDYLQPESDAGSTI